MRRFFRIVSVALGLVVFGDSAQAHHSQAGIFDSRKTIEVTGVVKSVSWRNPHGQILLSVRDEKGVETIWDAETASISILRNRGVDGSSIHVGDRIGQLTEHELLAAMRKLFAVDFAERLGLQPVDPLLFLELVDRIARGERDRPRHEIDARAPAHDLRNVVKISSNKR